MQRYFAKEYKDKLILQDSDIHHIKNVMRMNKNDKIEVVYDNKLYICTIEEINPLSLSIDTIREEDSHLTLDVTIAIGLVKEQKMDLILQKLTELGVNRIIPVNMERSIVKLDEARFQKKKVRWESICKEASEQSKRTSVPLIEDIHSLEMLASIDADYKFVCQTTEREKMLNNYLQNIKNYAKIIMVIGPEGGISEKEESLLTSNNYEKISLGPLIFRVETAAIYVASILNYYSSMR